MIHTCYHVLSDHNNEYFGTLPEVKSTIAKLKKNGESHIKVFQVFTEQDLRSDAIWLNEKQIRVS